MPAGKHTGRRSMITLPAEVDALFEDFARLVGKRKATVMAQYLVELVPLLRATVQSLEEGVSEDDLKARLGAMLVDLLVGDK
jgi:hypothetical protein